MKLKYNNKRGMTLVEVIVAIALIGIISISLLPMFVLSTRSNKRNEVKMNAMNIAYSQMEWIKGLKYNDIGCSPNGIIEENKYMNKSETIQLNGIEYTINTNVTWQKATSLLQGEIGEATKKVEVTVYLKNNNDECAALDTLITYEHEGEPQKPGNVYVYVFMKNNDNPVPGLNIKLENSNKKRLTDREGLATFGDLGDGEYTIIPEAKDDIMFEPTEVIDNNYFTSTIVSIKKDSREEKFYGEYPVFLNVNENFQDIYIWLQPDENSITPPDNILPEDKNDYMKITKSLTSVNNTRLWWKWIYKYEAYQQNTDNKYFLIDNKTNELWDGSFEEPGDENNVKVVNLAVGLNPETEVEILNVNGNRQIVMGLEFSAPVKLIGELQFSINDGPIENEYEIQNIYNDGYSKKIIIKFSDEANNLIIDDNSTIEIKNPEVLVDKYGIKLAKSLNKSSLKIINRE